MNIKTLNHNLTKGVLGISFLFFMGCSGNEQANQEVTETAPVQEEVAVVEPEEEGEPFVEPEDTAMEEEVVTQIAPPEEGPVLTMMSTSYADWNVDKNNVLDKNEFYNGIMKVWDADGNGSIDKKEFQNGTKEFFADYNYKKFGRFADWDANGNGSIDEPELEKGLVATVSGDKTAEALVTIWDTDNDDKIERVEMGNVTVRLDKDNN